MAFNTKMVIIWGSPILGQHVVGIIGWFPTFHAPSGGSMLQPSFFGVRLRRDSTWQPRSY